MSEIFISYARSTEAQARRIAEALKALGYGVWRDDELPAHRSYSEVIEERLQAAKAVVVVWSAEAAKSEWVQSEADRARADRKLVQLTVDGAALPMPFDRIQCADLVGWDGDVEAAGWRKVAASLVDLLGGTPVASDGVLAPPPLLPGKPSIAVLPFANLSGDPEQEYFADGMVVEITNALSRFKSLFVIASGSSLSFKGKTVSPVEAAHRLGVRFVLEGSVRKAANRVRITVQLIDAVDGGQIWTHRFDDTLEDVFALQDEVALAVAGVIEPMVREAEVRRAVARPTGNVGAYDLYLQALPLHRMVTKAGVLAALDLLDRALALDPDFGQALSLAAHCHQFLFTWGWVDDLESCRLRGIDLMHRALQVSPDDAVVLSRVATVTSILQRDVRSAYALHERAIALNPGSSAVWLLSGIDRIQAGDTDIGVEHVERSRRLDPEGPFRRTQILFLALARFQQERFEEAITLLNDAVQGGDYPFACLLLAACHGQLGQVEAGEGALARYRAQTSQPIEKVARIHLFVAAPQERFLEGVAALKGKTAPAEGEKA